MTAKTKPLVLLTAIKDVSFDAVLLRSRVKLHSVICQSEGGASLCSTVINFISPFLIKCLRWV